MNLVTTHTEESSVIADAQSCRGKSDQQRAEIFRDLQNTLWSIWQDLSAEEVQRRRAAARLLDPRPEPWWKNLREDQWLDHDAVAE